MKRVLLMAAILAACSVGVWAQAPALVNFQGSLIDAGGTPLEGAYTIEFRLWNKPVSGAEDEQLVWGASYDVVVAAGRFNVILGDSAGAPIDGAAVNDIGFAFGESERYLGITPTTLDGTPIASPAEITPRQRILSTAFAINAINAINATNGVPTGAIFPYAGGSAPDGYLVCNGSAVSRDTYADLFGAIGETWGAGDGSTTMNLPDLRGRTAIGAGTGTALTERTLGDTTVGEEAHTLTVDELASHSHDMRLFSDEGAPGLLGFLASIAYVELPPGSPFEPNTMATGGNQPHNIMQPSAVVNYIIKY